MLLHSVYWRFVMTCMFQFQQKCSHRRTALLLNMGLIVCPETSVINYQPKLHDNPKERKPQSKLSYCHMAVKCWNKIRLFPKSAGHWLARPTLSCFRQIYVRYSASGRDGKFWVAVIEWLSSECRSPLFRRNEIDLPELMTASGNWTANNTPCAALTGRWTLNYELEALS
jgi:hypothetical protein